MYFIFYNQAYRTQAFINHCALLYYTLLIPMKQHCIGLNVLSSFNFILDATK